MIFDGTMHVLYDYDEAKQRMGRKELAASLDFSLWRYSALLPVKEGARRPSLQVGWSPLYRASGIARDYGVREVLSRISFHFFSFVFKRTISSSRAISLILSLSISGLTNFLEISLKTLQKSSIVLILSNL